jgi:hypothetical protein
MVRLIIAAFVVFLYGTPVMAQSSLLGQEKKILAMIKANWVGFRNYNGRQLIYFTMLESYRCGIESVRYSLNSDALDKVWKLQPCDRKNPHAIKTTKPYLSLPLGTAKSIAVQLTFPDGSKSEIVHKAP